jgi:hypothetical protein
MDTFARIAELAGDRFKTAHEEKFLVGLEIPTGDRGRHQSVFLAEIRDDSDRRYLRIETTVAPLAQHDPVKALRINLMLRVGYLAVGDLESVPFLKLCENMAYRELSESSLIDTIRRVAELGDEIEQALMHGGDWF